MAQKGWVIDLSRCIGCKACAVACKAENNTYPATTPGSSDPLVVRNGRALAVNYRDVLRIEHGAFPALKHTFVTMACNHCADPACMPACPTSPKAIEKRASDGVVLIRQDLCIGCRYCEAACPYGAPQFNPLSNKMEKCTACVHRLDVGLQPACVTTCVGKALTWVDSYDHTSDGHGDVPEEFADPSLTNPSIKFLP